MVAFKFRKNLLTPAISCDANTTAAYSLELSWTEYVTDDFFFPFYFCLQVM